MMLNIIKRSFSSVAHIRNVGIIAHIDAGKTTTTERMLFYTGQTDHIGNVDSGDTVTDYMDQERERGITIVSAAVSMKWRGRQINLVDTPGHVDFSMEVERCLCVLDGAVTVLDGTRGVEAQTLTVWRQAARHRLPRLIYVNKMDRAGSQMEKALHSVAKRLHDVVPLPIQMPQFSSQNKFQGVVDLVNMKLKTWDSTDGSEGSKYSETCLWEASPTQLETAIGQRQTLLARLIELDPLLAEDYLNIDTPERTLTPDVISAALRRVTLSGRASPILCGSSRFNVGVQPLLDAILDYLPSPADRLPSFLSQMGVHPPTATHHPPSHTATQPFPPPDTGNHLRSLAFKTVHDKQRGPLTFLRVYTGHLDVGQAVYNATRETREKILRILQLTGDHYLEIPRATPGSIVAVSGLKNTYTGDFILNSEHHSEKEHNLPQSLLMIPDPVVFASIEAESLSTLKTLELALERLQKEDPSFQSQYNDETGQLVIAGVGDLHLEVMTERIRRDYGLDVAMGPLFIAYRETPLISSPTHVEHRVESKVDGRNVVVEVEISIQKTQDSNQPAKSVLVGSQEFTWSHQNPTIIRAVEQGCKRGLSSGPLMRCPVLGCIVSLHRVTLTPSRASKTDMHLVKACASEAVRKALSHSSTHLMEPVMKVEITLPGQSDGPVSLSSILGELTKRRAYMEVIESSLDATSVGPTNSQEDSTIIVAHAPLSELLGFSSTVRRLSSGRAAVHMELEEYQTMSEYDQNQVLHKRKFGI